MLSRLPQRIMSRMQKVGRTLGISIYQMRFTMGAPSCYLTSFERNYDNELPVDAEQVIPGLAAKGFEMADFLIGRAPNPAIILAKSNDFFDVRGAAANYEEVKRIYRLLGAEALCKRKKDGDTTVTELIYEAGFKSQQTYYRCRKMNELQAKLA